MVCKLNSELTILQKSGTVLDNMFNVPTGQSFKEWRNSSNEIVEVGSELLETETLTAKWKNNSYERYIVFAPASCSGHSDGFPLCA